jgi:hypothetical protein
MFRKPRSLTALLLALLALGGGSPCQAQPPARPESLIFRNDTTMPVVVQAACIIQGMLTRDRPYLLQINDSTPEIRLPGNKLITIYDPRTPARILFQGAIPANNVNQRFKILPDLPAPRVKIELVRP